MQFLRVTICAFTALATGALGAVAVQLAGSPALWSHPDGLVDFGLTGAVIYAALPVGVLVGLALCGREPSTIVSVGISVCWLIVIFAWWAAKPIQAYGEFPWWGFERHFLATLPGPLAVGLAFSVVARRLGLLPGRSTGLPPISRLQH